MSQQPPPPPYGGPPPGPYPPMPYQGPPDGPSGMSNKAKFWIGVALALPVMIVVAVATGATSAAVETVSGSQEAGGIASFLVGLLLFAAFVAAVVWARTRWFAIGIMAGAAVLLILAAGACVVLLVVLFNGEM